MSELNQWAIENVFLEHSDLETLSAKFDYDGLHAKQSLQDFFDESLRRFTIPSVFYLRKPAIHI